MNPNQQSDTSDVEEETFDTVVEQYFRHHMAVPVIHSHYTAVPGTLYEIVEQPVSGISATTEDPERTTQTDAVQLVHERAEQFREEGFSRSDSDNWAFHREVQPAPRSEARLISMTSDEFDENARQTDAEIRIIESNNGGVLGHHLDKFVIGWFLDDQENLGRVVHKYVQIGDTNRYDIIIPQIASPDNMIIPDTDFGAPNLQLIMEYALHKSVGTDCIDFQQIRRDYVPDLPQEAFRFLCRNSGSVNSYGNAAYGHIDVSTCDNVIRMYESILKVYNTFIVFEALQHTGYPKGFNPNMPAYFDLLGYGVKYQTNITPHVAWVIEDRYLEHFIEVYRDHLQHSLDLINSLNDCEFERVNLRPETIHKLENALWDRRTALNQIYLVKTSFRPSHHAGPVYVAAPHGELYIAYPH